jgi:acyl dehydratase
MGLNLDLVGRRMEARTHAYTWKDCVLYALGVGARTERELDFVFEAAGPPRVTDTSRPEVASGLKVLPTFAVVPSFTAMLDVAGRLGANMAMVVHGEQTIRLHRAIPPSGTFSTVAEVKGIYDKGKGALCVVEAVTTDDKGAPVFDNVFSIFVRGAGGFGGERGPETVAIEPPADATPAFAITERTSPEQAALYRLSGDLNPLHIAPQLAKLAGFDRPVLHGLCTYGFAGRAVLAGACGGDPAKLRSFAARFSAPVFPGDELTTSGWPSGSGRWIVRTVNQDGKVVLSNAVADVTT